jgi:hypothetical protein
MASKAEHIKVGSRREQVDQVLAPAERVRRRRGQADRRFKLGEPRRRRFLLARDERVEHDRHAAIELFLVFLHDGLAQARPGAKVDLAQGIAGAVFAIPDVLGREADAGSERHASRLVACSHGKVHAIHRVKRGQRQKRARA